MARPLTFSALQLKVLLRIKTSFTASTAATLLKRSEATHNRQHNMEDDPMFVTYHDTTLHQSDVAILSSNGWLNDRIIAFWFEYLTNEVFKDTDKLLFMDPNMMFMVSFCDDVAELKECIAPLCIEKRTMIFMPINNHNSIETAGGSHWALLVYNRDTTQFKFYDSSHGSNLNAASKIARKMHPLLDIPEGTEVEVTLERTPQQINGYDCGVYVCSLSEYVAKTYMGRTDAEAVNAKQVTNKRKEMKDLVLRLKAEQEKAKSGHGLFSLKRNNKK